MKIESPKTTVLKPATWLFQTLTDVSQFKTLMPDTIVRFEVVSDTAFLFALKGMPEITLQLKAKYPPKKILYESTANKIPYTLMIIIDEITPLKSEIQFLFEGKFNPVMAVMIKTPITNFIGTLSKNTPRL